MPEFHAHPEVSGPEYGAFLQIALGIKPCQIQTSEVYGYFGIDINLNLVLKTIELGQKRGLSPEQIRRECFIYACDDVTNIMRAAFYSN